MSEETLQGWVLQRLAGAAGQELDRRLDFELGRLEAAKDGEQLAPIVVVALAIAVLGRDEGQGHGRDQQDPNHGEEQELRPARMFPHTLLFLS
jgi:hypothetical protein